MWGGKAYALSPLLLCVKLCQRTKGGEGARILVTTFHRADK